MCKLSHAGCDFRTEGGEVRQKNERRILEWNSNPMCLGVLPSQIGFLAWRSRKIANFKEFEDKARWLSGVHISNAASLVSGQQTVRWSLSLNQVAKSKGKICPPTEWAVILNSMSKTVQEVAVPEVSQLESKNR
jgi:hypothetical protein